MFQDSGVTSWTSLSCGISAWEEVLSQPPEFKMCFQLPGALFLMICPGLLSFCAQLAGFNGMGFLFSLLPEVLVPTIAFLSKEEPETLQTPREILWLQSAHDGAAISYAEIDMQVENSFENSLE